MVFCGRRGQAALRDIRRVRVVLKYLREVKIIAAINIALGFGWRYGEERRML